jgi:hypothetical protein
MLESSLDGEREQIWRELGEPHKPLSIASVEEKLDQSQTRVRPSKSLYAGTSTGATEVGSGLYTPGD